MRCCSRASPCMRWHDQVSKQRAEIHDRLTHDARGASRGCAKFRVLRVASTTRMRGSGLARGRACRAGRRARRARRRRSRPRPARRVAVRFAARGSRPAPVSASDSCSSRRSNVARLSDVSRAAAASAARRRRRARDQLLGLAHAQLLGDDLVRREDLLRAVERQQRARMAHLDVAGQQHLLHRLAQVAAGAAGCSPRCASGRPPAPPPRASGRTRRSGAAGPALLRAG